MQPEDMILVSVDDHLVAPPTLFEGKMPTKGASLGSMSPKLNV
jgi:hypothetical protein